MAVPPLGEAPPPSVPGSLRTPVGVVTGVAVLVLVVGAALFGGQSHPSRVDGRAESLLDAATSAQRELMTDLAEFGSAPSVVACALGLALLAVLLARRRLAVLAVVGPGLTGVATTLLKPAFDRTLGGAYVYPSGHTAGGTALALVAALLLISVIRAGPAVGASLLAGAALLAGGTVGVGMVAMGVHYPTDAVGGLATAVAVVLGSALVIDAVADRRPWRGRLTAR